ncbi:MAG: hypothetical protein ACRCWY_02960 [Cellulosilyticaceae bacterium]
MKVKNIIITFLIMLLSTTTVFAAPYGSYIPSKYSTVDYSNTLYEPLTAVPVELTQPKDIFVDEADNLYVLQAKSILFIGDDNQAVELVGEDALTEATGIFVDANYIYVADKGAKELKIFDLQGQLLKAFGRPENNLFGSKSPYVPIKVSVNKNGQIFVLSDGNTNGLIQMDIDGNFIGYFGANTTDTSFFQKLKEKVLKDTALGSLIKTIPPSITNLDIDAQGVVYAAGTSDDYKKNIRRLNVIGQDIFLESPLTEETKGVIDVAVAGNFVFMLNHTNGFVSIADNYGKLVGIWGSKTNDTPVDGLFLNPIAIETDSNSNVYVLDEGLNNIQVFEPTEFMNNIFTALTLYKEGKYDESKAYWEGIVKVNRNSVVANESLGLLARKDQSYDKSMAYFEKAGDKDGYSDSLWEVREKILTKYLGLMLIALFVLYGLGIVYSSVIKKTKWMQKIQKKLDVFKERQLVGDFLKFKQVIKKPNHIFYRLKTRNTISLKGATIIAVIGLALVLFADYSYSYLFFDGYKENFDIVEALIQYVLVFGLYILSNFLITSILDGEGKLKHIYIGTIYALAPYVLFALPVALFSNVLTLNDVFMLDVLKAIMIIGVVILLIIVHIEIHNYRFMESVKVLILTAGTMLIIFIVTTTLLSLFSQLIIFFLSLLKEVIGRV